ncbi:hypothetical protein ACTMS2_20015 [Micromonospora sp. SD12]|uniref:hypothetical protein n=1 Tax=Micromonospora sp. SD12 TaxID=3452216 RepID=UPI003F89E4B2
MDFRPLPRPTGAFQRSIGAEDVRAICHRVFGPTAEPVSTVELGGGLYNNTHRLELADREPAILRVAPEPERQFRSGRELMRTECASLPWLAR